MHVWKNGRYGVLAGVAVVLAGFPVGSPVLAEVLEIRANIESTIQEFVDGQEGSFGREIGELGTTAPDPPLEAEVEFGHFAAQPGALHGGFGRTSFDDPTLSGVPNPQEFGLEAVCFSVDPAGSIGYEVTTSAIEVRDVVLGTDELKVPESGDENLVNSAVFLSGAILVWSALEGTDLSGVSAEFEFEVIQEDSTGTNGEVVFTTSVLVEGLSDSEVEVTQFGSIETVLGGPTLTEVTEELIGLGQAHVLLIPEQVINYAYLARAEEPFELRAEVRLKTTNVPADTGVAAVFGRPFTELAEAIGPSLPSGSGAKVQVAVNKAIYNRAEPQEEPAEAEVQPRACGVLAAEVPLALGFVLCSLWVRVRR